MLLNLAGGALNEDCIIKMEQGDPELNQEAASESWVMLIKTPSEHKCCIYGHHHISEVKNKEVGDCGWGEAS